MSCRRLNCLNGLKADEVLLRATQLVWCSCALTDVRTCRKLSQMRSHGTAFPRTTQVTVGQGVRSTSRHSILSPISSGLEPMKA